ncbi:MAG TPA: ribosome maturation factor RimM [Bacteroidota bacterium]|nr:ribosome maturation factor RimM [Bacteroidota bacterium]
MNSRVLIAVGRIVKAFGIRGELVVSPMTDSVLRFSKLKQVFVGRDDRSVRETEVTHVSLDAEKRGVRLQLAGYNDRTAASELVGSFLFVDERDAVRPAEGAYFIHDLIGLRVLDERGTVVGVVREVVKYPAQDVYVLECNGTEVMVPAVKEFIRQIDLDAGTMTIHFIEGMLSEPETVQEKNSEES